MSSTLPAEKMFALVDCNNFYVSCERVFNPGLRGIPVVVLSNNDGCVIARSAESKKLGMKIGTPAFQCEAMLKKAGGVMLSSNYALYGDMSRRVMEVLSMFTPAIEVYSIDESFLSLNGFRDLPQYGARIRTTVYQWTGIPVSVGIAPTKALAKMANKIAKKKSGGVFALENQAQIQNALADFPMEDIWGIGMQYAALLKAHGIDTALKVAQLDDAWALKKLTVTGLRLVHELRGISCIDLELSAAPKKAICSSRSFSRQVDSADDLRAAVADYAANAASKLRRQNGAAGAITVFIATNRFKDEPQYGNSATMKFDTPTDYTPDIVRRAAALLDSIYRSSYRYKKAGVLLTGIVPADSRQLSLFDSAEHTVRQKKISNAMDSLNRRYGRHTLSVAAETLTSGWQMHRARLSPSYTTKWDDIAIAKS